MRPGDEFAGRYVLKEVVGAGRGGEVWLAHDTVVGQDVALKPERVEGDRERAVRRILGEPRALAKFRDHPHVVTLYDVVTVERRGEETYWFVMEYVPGGGLDRRAPVSPERAAAIGAQLADALAALHAAGVVHCDVKPANIGLTRRGTAKLLDFGAAYRAGGTETVTANGPLSFTPAFAAPELARGNIPQPASDVFCLAATVHALVTGAPPRGRASGEDSGYAQGAGAETERVDSERLAYWKAEQGVVELDADAVGPLFPVLGEMLRRDPGQRPDAAEAGRLLTAVAEGDNGPQGPAGTRSRTPLSEAVTEGGADTNKPARTRSWALLVTAVAGVAALATLLGVLLVPGDDDPSHPQPDPSRLTDGAADRKPRPQALIGDPRTADLCALTDPDALGRFGRARTDVEYGNFDRCDVLVERGDRARVDVSVSLRRAALPESPAPARTVGGISVVAEPPKSDECGRLLSTGESDGLLVRIRVDENDGPSAGAELLCEVADQAADTAAEALDDGPLPRRAAPYPKDSLAWSNACQLLDSAALLDALGADPNTSAGVAGWSCEWSDHADDLTVKAGFFRDQAEDVADGKRLTLSGYDAHVREDDDGESCTALVEYRPYTGPDARQVVEMLRLDVDGDRPTRELCELATGLARSAAGQLPPR